MVEVCRLLTSGFLYDDHEKQKIVSYRVKTKSRLYIWIHWFRIQIKKVNMMQIKLVKFVNITHIKYKNLRLDSTMFLNSWHQFNGLFSHYHTC